MAHDRDSLNFILSIMTWILKYKSLFVLAICMFMLFSWSMSVYIFDLIVTFDSTLIFKYGGHAGFQIFVLINLGNAIIMGSRATKNAEDFREKLLPLNLANSQTSKDILRQLKFLKIAIYSNTVVALMSAALLSVDNNYNENRVYFYLIIENMSSRQVGNILFLLYRLSYFLVAFVSLQGTSITCFIGFNAKFQIMIIKEFIEDVCDADFEKEEDQYYNQLSQMIMGEKLKICFMLYHSIYSEVKTYIALNYIPTLLILVGVLFLGGGLMIEIFSNSDIHASFTASFLLVVCGVLSLGLYTVSGQKIKDQSEDLRLKLTMLPWYNMDKKNKLLFHMLMMRIENIVSFDISLVQSDYTLIVRISRVLYSLSTLISPSIKMKNK